MMALGGCSLLKNATMLEQLLEEINFQRTKEMRQLLKDDSGFIVLQGTTYWTDLFVRHFLFQEEQAIDCDDLLFFVRKRHVKGSSRHLPKYETQVEVFRKDSKKLPIGDPEIDWEETVYLNLVVHQFDYTLTLAICTRTSPKELQVLRRHSQKVFCDIIVRDGEMVCVELVARGRGGGAGGAQTVIFLGSIRYDALTRVYESRQSSLSSKVAQRMSFGLLGGKTAARCEFVRMKGPAGKGHAEMAVARPHGAGADTPCSEPGLSATELWDPDWEQDPEEMYLFRHQRRLSDPSANIGQYSRGGWRARDPAASCRSESEGLDRLDAGVAEVTAADLRDVGSQESQASSRVAPPPAPPALPRMGVPLGEPRPAPRSPACLQRAPPSHPAHPGAECELADDAADLEEAGFSPRRTRTVPAERARVVRGREELPCYRELHVYRDMRKEDGGGARSYCTAPRRRGSIAAILFKRGELPPRRTTPDGTHIYYWCDMPEGKRDEYELDDGLCQPVWALRGSTQAFHVWKEGRRQQSAPLNAYLTYVTLPWWTIAKDILDHREEPILTF